MTSWIPAMIFHLCCIHGQPVPPYVLFLVPFFPVFLKVVISDLHFSQVDCGGQSFSWHRCQDRYRLGFVTKHDSSKLLGVTLRQGKRVVKRVDFIEREVANSQLLGLAFVEWKSWFVCQGFAQPSNMYQKYWKSCGMYKPFTVSFAWVTTYFRQFTEVFRESKRPQELKCVCVCVFLLVEFYPQKMTFQM